MGSTSRYSRKSVSSQTSSGGQFASKKSLPEPYAWSDTAAEQQLSAKVEARYRTGQKVQHAKFGNGIVVESKVIGNDEEVTVAFTNEGIKKLVASLARLSNIE